MSNVMAQLVTCASNHDIETADPLFLISAAFVLLIVTTICAYMCIEEKFES